MRRLPTVYFDPGIYHHLPENFQPPQDGSAGFRNGKAALVSVLPVRNLPKGLIPKRGLHVQPPRFHYGWTFSVQELYDTATQFGFVALYDSAIPPGTEPTLDDFSGFSTQLKLAQIVRERLKISSCSPEFVIVSGKKPICISLTNNYKRGNIPPPKADVEAIQKLLGKEESEAAWVLEAQSCHQWDIRIF
ncbi:hypothetical protein M413DRAFT_32837 [Hebeloma cylindrosporum]|uniref:Uncharacterized protein n=1 Tax=Hebeloma cylindrosporum TaxID=76867 RepID=A0A0C3BDZ3_HEBCY|nr:hypothetical protein M413DRAFT_32837 [Hebeloma cylindrosporum h7]